MHTAITLFITVSTIFIFKWAGLFLVIFAGMIWVNVTTEEED